jgi:hypothetical protein
MKQTKAHPSATHWLETVRHTERCQWCGDDKPLTKGLCRSCRTNQSELAKARINFQTHAGSAFDESLIRMELGCAQAKIELCQADGEALHSILNGDDESSQILEEYLSDVSRSLCSGSDLFGGLAGLLSEAFAVDQRKLLAYLIWKMMLVRNKRNRKSRAVLYATQKMMEGPEESRE